METSRVEKSLENRLEKEQLIEKYILNRMDDEEAFEFEAYYLSDQECLEQLELAEKLYQGLGSIVDSTGVEVEISEIKEASNDGSWWGKKVPAWSLAAMLMIAILPSGLLYQQMKQGKSPQSSISVVDISMSEQRGQREQTVKIKSGDKQVILSSYIDTEIEGFEYPAYGFELKSQNGDVVNLKVADLQLGNDGMLYIDLGNNYLKPGIYEFSILGVSDSDKKVSLRKGVLAVTK